jgi:HAD superfamily hydrolase (TIGR01459 family)
MTPPIVTQAGPILVRYEAVFCDVWGVMHNGRAAHAESGEALARFRSQGGTVVLVSNAPVPAAGVERVLERTGVRRDAWDAIVSSGDIALAHITEKGYLRLHRIGPSRRDSMLFARLPGDSVPLSEADAIVCTGLADEANETVETYRGLIEEGVARGLPFVCANPDLLVDVGDRRYLCAGSLAAEYERRGGSVFWAGKPHPSAYEVALAPRRIPPAFSPSAMPHARISRRRRAWASMRCSSPRASTIGTCWPAGKSIPTGSQPSSLPRARRPLSR